jgi:BirA family transcriptional regulator, biotin operon repressor / biotin---[acetyl-CoA-carboxylase] ligase
MQRVCTTQLIKIFESLPSTNLTAKQMAAEGAVHGTSVIAKNQTAGRGRLGKKWLSSEGRSLLCSIIVRPQISVQDIPKITLAAGIGVVLALETVTRVKVQVKWPNDIFIDEKKCAGILCETSSLHKENGMFVIIGIGVNINQKVIDFPVEIREQATSLFLVTGVQHEVFEVFKVVYQSVMMQLNVLCNGGFKQILSNWRERDFLLGKKIQCVSSLGEIVTGVSVGTDGDGQLHIRDSDGNTHSVLSGDIRLGGAKEII